MNFTPQQEAFRAEMMCQTPEFLTDELIKLAISNANLQKDFNHLAVVCYQILSELGVMDKDGNMSGDMSTIIGSISTLAMKSMLPGNSVEKRFAFVASLGEVWQRRNEEIMNAVNQAKSTTQAKALK